MNAASTTRHLGAHGPQEAARLAAALAAAALDKKGEDVEVINVWGKVDYADQLVVITGRNDRHVAALTRYLAQAGTELGNKPVSVEGLANSRWVLIDFGDVIVHLFHEEMRPFYDLSSLWVDAERTQYPLAS